MCLPHQERSDDIKGQSAWLSSQNWLDTCLILEGCCFNSYRCACQDGVRALPPCHLVERLWGEANPRPPPASFVTIITYQKGPECVQDRTLLEHFARKVKI